MKVLIQLLKEFWLPLLLGAAWTAYNLADRQGNQLSIRETINIFGPTFFFMSWLVAQWLRVKKQQKFEEGLSGIQADVSSLSAPLLPCELRLTLKQELSSDVVQRLLVKNKHINFLPGGENKSSFPIPPGVDKARIHMPGGRFVDVSAGIVEAAGVSRLKLPNYNMIHAPVKTRFASIESGQFSNGDGLVVPTITTVEFYLDSAMKHKNPKPTLALRTGLASQVVVTGVEIFENLVYFDLVISDFEMVNSPHKSLSSKNLKNSKFKTTLDFMFIQGIESMPDRSKWPSLHNLQLWMGVQSPNILSFTLEQLANQKINLSETPLVHGDAKQFQISVEQQIDESLYTKNVVQWHGQA
jgi:hypothetical protein